ncbi:MAG: hypothetical protein ABF586_05495 [Sporolactobacillus sp.]
MTKQITSIKLPMHTMNGPNLRRLLRLYERIKKSNCSAYFTIDGRTYTVEQLLSNLSSLIVLRRKEVFIVLEGEEAGRLHHQLINDLRIAEENARENPGLYREP